jgi:glycerol kinase
MTADDTLMQLQADLLGIPVVRPVVAETTALGAAYAAGLAAGFWSGLDELRANWREDRRWLPSIGADERAARLATWRRAVERTFDWVERAE